MSTTGAPPGGETPPLAWTGSELLVYYASAPALYDPCADKWRAGAALPGLVWKYVVQVAPANALLFYNPLLGNLSYLWKIDLASGQSSTLNLDGAILAQDSAVISIGTGLLSWSGVIPDPAPSVGESGSRAGAIYDLASARWRPMAVAGAPAARTSGDSGGVTFGAPALWTGSTVAVWGGRSADTVDGLDCYKYWYKSGAKCPVFQDGAVYDLAADSWTPMGDVGAPAPRYQHVLAWTGDRILVWGGKQPGTYDPATNILGPESRLKDGGLYDPKTKTWTAIAPSPFAFPQYDLYSETWTGDRLLLKANATFDSALYDPRTQTWSAVPPPNVGDVCSGKPVVQAGAVVMFCEKVAGVPSVVLLLPGATTWRSFPLPSKAPRGVLWTGKRLFLWGELLHGPIGCETPPPPGFGCDPLPPAYGNTGFMLIP